MKDRFKVIPKRVARGRKIQVRQFEPEELWIEYELEVTDPSAAEEAVLEATRLAREYLDDQEQMLRGVKESPKSNGVVQSVTEYGLELTNKGNNSQLYVKKSKDPKFVNFIHLWFGKKQGTYVGYLRKDTGKFVIKDENVTRKYGFKEGTHFKIVQQKKMASTYG